MSSAVGGEDISVSSEEAILDSTPSDTFPGSKLCKAPKPGGNASSEAIKLWRENGFSRYLQLFTNYFLYKACVLPSIDAYF